jgi:hypothetical protein
MLATIGELPNGVLAMPRLLSNLSDAPMLGEAAILWQLSIQPERGLPVKTGGSLPAYVYIVLLSLFLFGTWRILDAIWTFREARHPPEPTVWTPAFQVFAWGCLMLSAIAALAMGRGLIGIALLVIAVMLPVVRKKKPTKEAENWPDAKPAPATNAQPAHVIDG